MAASLQAYVGVSSSVFSIEAQGAYRGAERRIRVVVERLPRVRGAQVARLRVLRWQE